MLTPQEIRGLFVIVDGMVEVFGGPDVSSRLLNTMGAGAYVGEISLVRDTPTSARVTARTQVKALYISTDSGTHWDRLGIQVAANAILRSRKSQ